MCREGGDGQRRAHCGVDRHQTGLVEAGNLVLIGERDRPGEGNGWGEIICKLPHGRGKGLEPIEEQAALRLRQGGHHKGQNVQHPIEHRQSGQMSGKHGAEHGEGVEKEAQPALDQQPLDQGPEGQTPQGRLRGGGEGENGQLG